MPHLDEGTIHAWLDGALPPDERSRAEAHAAECATCAAAVAEARGLVAASSRILTALDDVPGEVVPVGERAAAAIAARRRPRLWATRYARIAAAAALVMVGVLVVREGAKDTAVRNIALDTVPASVTMSSDAPAAPPAPEPVASARSRPRAGGDVAGALRTPAEADLGRDAPTDELAAGANARPAPALARAVEERATASDAARQEYAESQRRAEMPPPPAPSASIVNPGTALRIRGMNQLAGAKLSQVQGRVTDSAGAPIPSAQVTVLGTDAGGLTAADGSFRIAGVPEGTQVVEARRLGYASSRETIDARGDSVSVNLALSPTAMRLDDVVTTGAPLAEAEAERAIPGLTLLNTSESVLDGRPVRRSLYQLRPGVTVTLVERLASAEESGPPAAAAPEGLRSARAGPSTRQRSQDSLRDKDAPQQINTIWWTSRDGTEFMLSGAVTVEELEGVRRKIEVGSRE